MPIVTAQQNAETEVYEAPDTYQGATREPIGQLEHLMSSNAGSQAGRILMDLQDKRGKWVSMPALARIGSGSPHGFCMVHSRVTDLRRRGHNIENHCERQGGKVVSSFYRLV